MNAIRLHVEIKKDHVIRLPPEVPLGPAEVIVIAQGTMRAGRRPVGIDADKGFSVPENFDDPLPQDENDLGIGNRLLLLEDDRP